jgi:hypothetical protein
MRLQPPSSSGSGRSTKCWNCGKVVIEANYGNLDNGGVNRHAGLHVGTDDLLGIVEKAAEWIADEKSCPPGN